jgi:hypothetical protein
MDKFSLSNEQNWSIMKKATTIFLLSIFACYADSPEIVIETLSPDEQSVAVPATAPAMALPVATPSIVNYSKPQSSNDQPVLTPTESSCTDPVCQAPAQMILSHNFGRGVGHKGYSSADLFFIRANSSRFYPFADLRFHVMDDGKFAFNGGLGFRRLVLQDNLSVGANVYYDYRDSTKLNTQQISGGIELLSQHIDFRLNGYVPFSGKKQSGHLKFVDFSGHQANFNRKTHYAFASTNAEFGVPLPWMSSKHVDTYIGVGPYYLFGKNVSGNRYRNSWGGKFRLEVGITDYLDLKFELNQDRIFHTTCQGVVAINIPLYKKTACSSSCSSTGKEAYFRRTLRPVMRNEIIPVKKKSRTTTLKDSEGNPIQVFFVNNLAAACPGVGTFESPFCTLAGASGAPAGPVLIYVFEGNSSTSPYIGGFVMKDGQVLQGSGTALDISGVTIPPQTAGSPHILVNVNGVNAVQAASFTTIQGFNMRTVATSNSGVYASGVKDVQIMNNTFDGFVFGVDMNPPAGNLYIAGNTILNSTITGINILNATGPGFIQIVNNTISQSTNTGVGYVASSADVIGLIANNTISNFNNNGIFSTLVPGAITTIESNTINSTAGFSINTLNGKHTIQNNVIVNTGAIEGINSDVTVAAPAEAYIYNNTVTMTNPASVGIHATTFTQEGPLYTEIVGNHVTSPAAINGILVDTIFASASDNICASITGNTSTGGLHINRQNGVINIQQTLAELSSENTATITPTGTINYGSSCTAP